MSYEQLSDAFLGTNRRQQELGEWRAARLLRQQNLIRETSLPWVMLHLLPSSSTASRAIELGSIFSKRFDFSHHALNNRNNHDGVVMMLGAPSLDPREDYIQWFRSGAVEIAWSLLKASGAEHAVNPFKTIHRIIQTVPQCCDVLESLGVTGPVQLQLRMAGVLGKSLCYRGPDGFSLQTSHISHDAIELGPLIGDTSALATNPLPEAKVLLDRMFQSFGEESCPYFDHDGSVREQEILRYSTFRNR